MLHIHLLELVGLEGLVLPAHLDGGLVAVDLLRVRKKWFSKRYF